jgi:hypothetical protein
MTATTYAANDTYQSNVKGPFTAGKSHIWVEADTLNECADLYVEAARKHNLGMGTIYRSEAPMGVRRYINANGVIGETV